MNTYYPESKEAAEYILEYLYAMLEDADDVKTYMKILAYIEDLENYEYQCECEAEEAYNMQFKI